MSAHILVVEPEYALQAALSSWLEWEGYDCACASDPEEALAMAEHDRADVALVSDHPTAWNASGLAGELKARHEDLAIILLCGVAGQRPRRTRRSRDVLDEIPAPITRGAVRHAVTRAVQWRGAAAADREACLAHEEVMLRHASELREALRVSVDPALLDPANIPAGAQHAALLRASSPVGDLMERRHPGAVTHATRVTQMARLLGEGLRLTPRAMAALERAAFLHDLGKAALPEQLLQKPTPLSDLEIGLLRRHPLIAAEILADIPPFEDTVPIVLSTQERFDGTGYPHGLAALEIPMSARIITLVDAFDRLTVGHPLGAKLSLPEACAELVRGAGAQFDPDLVRIWLRVADAVHGPFPQ
jgi:response regulator RpfG family c-di-GMP phosphodiesterase